MLLLAGFIAGVAMAGFRLAKLQALRQQELRACSLSVTSLLFAFALGKCVISRNLGSQKTHLELGLEGRQRQAAAMMTSAEKGRRGIAGAESSDLHTTHQT